MSTAARDMLEQGDRELCAQHGSVLQHVPTGRFFECLPEDPDVANPVGEGVGLRFGEEHMVAFVARKSQFSRLPVAGEHLLLGTRRFQIADVRNSEDGHLVGFICPQNVG